jgi:hypothetical protein
VSLRELLPSASPLLLPCDESQICTPLTDAGKEGKDILPPATIQVAISRQIVIEVNGRRRARTFTLAEGRLWPIPPCPSPLVKEQRSDSAKVHREPIEDECEKTAEVSLDWQGEVKCGPQVRFGGFLSSHVSIKVGAGFVLFLFYLLVPGT